MYRVVLIDDENIIVEGLRRVVKWADYDCEVVGTAGDAEEGTELIRKLQPPHCIYRYQDAGQGWPYHGGRPPQRVP